MPGLKLSLNGVNYLNIGLMVISMILAINIPFELFLFVYAVLGPLHYMTEIGWLHKKNYFAIEKRDFVIPIVMCALISASVLLSLASGWESTSAWIADAEKGALGPIIRGMDRYSPSFIFMAFAAAIFMVVIKKRTLRYLLIALMIIPGVLIIDLKFYDEEYITWFAVFLPTIVHVCVFTGLFILFGAMKSKSISGYISFGVFILCIVLLFLVRFDPIEYAISEETLSQMRKSTFDQLNYSLWDIIHPIREKTFYIDGTLGLKIQAFVAFAYTYHYLNWFSKTEIIKWHDVPKPWLILTIVVWIASILLYRYDYRVGLLSLYFLSMMHVFLEFPLNIQSLIGIGKEGSGWFRKNAEAKT